MGASLRRPSSSTGSVVPGGGGAGGGGGGGGGGCRVAIVVVLLFGWLHSQSSAYKELVASFYGDSYIKVPVQESRAETEIRLSFQTAKSDGLLLLAAGTYDYCLITVESGGLIIHLDLGSGDAVLSSSPGFTFNDLSWHSLLVHHRQGNVTLTVDGKQMSSTVTPGSFFELNIDKHLYVGGIPDADRSIYVGSLPAFRGCLQGVKINGINVLEVSKNGSDLLNVHSLTWDCSSEFAATSDQPISFLGARSFIAFPIRDIPDDTGMTFAFRTNSQNALLVFSSGHHFDSDFLAIEIVSGKLRLTLFQGTAVAIILSEDGVSNGHWHNVEVTSDESSVSLAVNKSMKQKRDIRKTKFFQRNNLLYLGGVGVKARAIASYRRLNSIRDVEFSGSLVGCIMNVTINHVTYGFPEAIVTRELAPGCSFSSACQDSICRHGKKCHEEQADDQHCVCVGDQCAASDESRDIRDGLLSVKELVVTEGRRVELSAENIAVSDEYKIAGIQDSQVIFQVVNSPNHGEIFVNSDARLSDRVEFSLMDLMMKRVSYIHDDSEVNEDSIGMQLEFHFASSSSSDDMFHKKYGFTLMVNVLPNNDWPELILPVNNSLEIVSGTSVKITTKILNISDADDSSSNLEYTIISSGSGSFEVNDGSGARTRVLQFTHEDVTDGRIRYASQKGASDSEVKLRISDGKYQSEIKILKVIVIPLELTQTVNTGLLIRRGSVHLITRFNLSTVTNSVHQDIEVRYDVKQLPHEGELQRQQNSDNQWTSASAFTQKHIDRNRLRYVHKSDSQSSGDNFRFQVSALGMELQEFEFNIQVIETSVHLLHCTGLYLNGTREGLIRSDALKAVSTVPYHGPSDITYNIIATPTKGHLFRLERRTSGRSQKRRLSHGSNFTQAEVNEGRIGYKFQKALYSPMTDDFEFMVLIHGAQSGVSLFALSYEPIEGAIRFINNGLVDVLEGEGELITPEDLFTEKNDVRNFRYTVTDGPRHGVLQLINRATKRILQNNITAFSNDDIKDGRLFYQHDDSETDEDMFSFTTTPIINQPRHVVLEITELSGTFDIKIVLRNDNEPRREVEKVFNVVANRGRIIMPSDIWYTDPDVNYDSQRLEYKLINISNGDIVLVENHSVIVHHFMQRDISEGRLYFRHKGPRYGRSLVSVTDGSYISTGILEVKASEPYVRVINGSVIMVEKGQSVDLEPKHFSIETNLDASDQGMRFVIVDPPRHGIIKRNKAQMHRFNMADMKSRLVSYEHGNGVDMEDSFKFLARIENFQSLGAAQIIVTSEAYRQHSPKVVSNKVSTVEEHDVLTLTPDLLNVTHPSGSTSCIKFSIINPPKHGRLSLAGKQETSEVLEFMQEDVNAGRVAYRHVDRDRLSDVFQFDVHCGTSVLTGLEFVIEVVPKTIPLAVMNVTVDEGETTYVNENILKIGSKFYQNQPVEFMVVGEPLNGKIVNLNFPEQRISVFHMEHVKDQKIAYVHDGSETLSDRFDLKANVRSKKSDLKTVHVTVLPKNDEPPVVLTNKRLDVWTGVVVPITQNNLYAEDRDTEPQEIVYVVRQMKNGSVSAIGNKAGTPLGNFTQADINQKQITFVLRDGAHEGSFDFQVTDGVRLTDSMTFHVEYKTQSLSLDYARTLEVFPGLIQPITSYHLKASINDSNRSHPIIYTVQTKPKHGRLITYSTMGLEEEVTSFVQDKLNEKLILYQHSGRMEQWSQMDSFAFEVQTAYAPSLDMKILDIFISYDNINEFNKDQLMTLTGTVVNEGNVVVISKAELDISKLKSKLFNSGLRNVEVSMVIREAPRHGTIRVRGEDAAVGTRFVQDDVNRGRVAYEHDHTDSLWDEFSFSIELETKKKVNAPNEGYHHLNNLVNTFGIIIRPLNDQPFVLRTQSPTIKLIQGSIKNITRNALFAEDRDTPPENIKYEIMTPPNNGLIINVKQPNQSSMSFTQRDIDQTLIVFIHDGSKDSGAFYFRVSDGKHKPLYKVFNICVIPLTLEMPGPSVLELFQGKNSVLVSSRNVNVTTNGKKENVVFNVTRGPQHGNIYLQNSISDRFSQSDVEDGRVAYIQTNLNYPNDSIEFTLSDGHNVLLNRRLEITVQPNLKKSHEPFRVVAGNKAIITTKFLDASDLARMSGSDPAYHVTVAPQQGRLTKTTPSMLKHRRDVNRRKLKNKDSRKKPDDADFSESNSGIFVFTHNDVVNEHVSYHPAFSHGMSGLVQDSFSFILKATNVQPAHGRFEIEVDQTSDLAGDDDSDEKSEDPSNQSSSNKDDSSTSAHESPSKMQMKTAFIVCGVVLLLIIFLIAFKCYRRHRRKTRQLTVTKEDSKSRLADPSSPISVSSDVNTSMGGVDNRIQSLSSLNNAGPTVPVINVTPDTPNSARRNIPGRQQTQAVVEPPPLNHKTITPLDSRTISDLELSPGEFEDNIQNELGDSISRQSSTDGNGGKRERAAFDWENIDPELLEHCRKTTPVLHKNQYWV